MRTLEDHRQRLLEAFHDEAQEARGVGAVDHPMIVRERERQHVPGHELIVLPDRFDRRARHAEDGDFRRVDDRRLALASYAYLIFFVSMPTLIFRAGLRNYATPLRLRVAILGTFAVATALPDLLHYVIRQPEMLDLHYSGRHLMSPLQTLSNWRTVEQNGWVAVPFALGAIGLLALIVLVHTCTRQAAEDESITPHRPAPAAGEPDRADLIY